MKCTNPIWINKKSNHPWEKSQGMEVPCGHCLNCDMQKQAEWAIRVLHESESWEESIFLTLTYAPKHLPEYGSLRKKDLQNFFKRLRFAIGKRKIKYFACGEYGDEKDRPHYHAIVFGLGFRDKEIIKDCWPFANWKIPEIEKEAFGICEHDSIDYVCAYTNKQIGKLKEDERENAFKIMSKGIGREYVMRHADKIKDRGYIVKRGVKRSIPRYYVNKAQIDINSIKERAKQEEAKLVKSIIGIEIDRESLYTHGLNKDILKVEKKIRENNKQRERNRIAKRRLKTREVNQPLE